MIAIPALMPIVVPHHARSPLAPTAVFSGSSTHPLLALSAACMVLSGALVAVGHLAS